MKADVGVEEKLAEQLKYIGGQNRFELFYHTKEYAQNQRVPLRYARMLIDAWDGRAAAALRAHEAKKRELEAKIESLQPKQK